MRLYIIRHADPDYPNKTITAKGHEEARALAERMKQVGLSRIYTSPMGRAQHTAQYTADATGLDPVILPWTAELRIDPVEGVDGTRLAAWNLEGQRIRSGAKMPCHDNWQAQPELSHYDYLGRYEQLQKDSDEFLRDLGYDRDGGIYRVRKGNEDNEEHVAVFCHGGFGVTWMAHLLALPLTLAWCGFFLAPSSVSVILMEQRTPEIAVPRALHISDTAHIHVAKLAHNYRGVVGKAF